MMPEMLAPNCNDFVFFSGPVFSQEKRRFASSKCQTVQTWWGANEGIGIGLHRPTPKLALYLPRKSIESTWVCTPVLAARLLACHSPNISRNWQSTSGGDRNLEPTGVEEGASARVLVPEREEPAPVLARRRPSAVLRRNPLAGSVVPSRRRGIGKH